jgi:hypothetical protein
MTTVVLQPIDSVRLHPRNPRIGDIAKITDSIKANGFFGYIVAQESTSYCLIGNHRLQAAIQLGLTEIPTVWVDVDDAEALRILLDDNRTSDLGTYDEQKLTALLESLPSLDGTLFDEMPGPLLKRRRTKGSSRGEMTCKIGHYKFELSQPEYAALMEVTYGKDGAAVIQEHLGL